MHFHVNHRVDRSSPLAAATGGVLTLSGVSEAEREIASWPGYRPTPLRHLPGLAELCGVRQVWYKDEADRFGLGSFKALGGGFGVLRTLQYEIARRTAQPHVSANDVRAGKYGSISRQITVSCATDGNHGRAVAWGAKLFGCRAVIYLPRAVSVQREEAIADHGAEIVRVDGTYDDAVRAADGDASAGQRLVVSDTAYPGYMDVPRDVMQGYTVMLQEVLRQLPAGIRPSHVLVQAGVGGLAAAVCAHLWEHFGSERPVLVVVEPETAACVLTAAAAGRPTVVPGTLDTVMGCLSAGEVSHLAWQILEPGADAFMTIPDDDAVAAMRLLADSTGRDHPIVAGESGAAGTAGLIAATQDRDIRERLGLTPDSCVLLFGTEGATDPVAYERIVGRPAREVGEATG